MQTGKKVVETVKETSSNIAAAAQSGMDKTKAAAQEKVDKIRAHDDFEKGLATERKDERMAQAEHRKLEAYSHNAAQKHHATEGGGAFSNSASGVAGKPTGPHQMSALPGHGTGEPAGGYVEKGTEAGTTRTYNTRSSAGRNGSGYNNI